MNNLIPLFVAIPLGIAFIIPMISRRIKGVAAFLGNVTMIGLSVMSLVSIGKSGMYHMGGWDTPIGIDLRLDGLSVLMLLSISIVGFAATLFSTRYMQSYTSRHRYYSLFLFMVAGMNGAVLAADIFNLYVFMEIASIASFALVAFGCGHEDLEAAFKYIVLGGVAATFVLFGIAIIYGVAGTLNMAHLAMKIGNKPLSNPLVFALGLFISGFGLKAAMVPFHSWLPDAHPSAPAPISAMLSGVLIKAIGVYVIARLLFNVFGITPRVSLVLQILGTLSMIVGVLLAIGQWDMKRLFAYHSISQVGYIIIGLGLGTPLGIVGALYHLVNHSVFKSLLFLNAGAVEYSTGTRNLKRLGGLYKTMPVAGSTSLIASMSIAGIPPFNGFWSKLIIIIACVMSGHYWLGAWAVLVSILTLASFLKVQRYGFFDSLKISVEQIKKTPPMMALAMILLAVLCVGMGFFVITGFDSPIIIGPAAESLLKGVFVL